jgi:hypothetical protein
LISFVVARIGFGIGDLLDAALQYSDVVLLPLVDIWPTTLRRDEDEPEDETSDERIHRIRSTPVRLTRQELSRHRSADGSGLRWLDGCLHPDRAKAAWAWATREADQAAPQVGINANLSSSALALRHRNRTVPVPAGLVLGALCQAAAELCATAGEIPLDLFIRKATAQRATWLAGLPTPSTPDDALKLSKPWHSPTSMLWGTVPVRRCWWVLLPE